MLVLTLFYYWYCSQLSGLGRSSLSCQNWSGPSLSFALSGEFSPTGVMELPKSPSRCLLQPITNVISFSRRNSPGHCVYVSLKDWGVLSKIPWGVSSVKQREDKSLCVAPAFQEKAPISTEKRGKRLLCKVHSVWDWSRGSDPFTSC